MKGHCVKYNYPFTTCHLGFACIIQDPIFMNKKKESEKRLRKQDSELTRDI